MQSEGFARLYEEHLPRVFQFVAYKVGDKQTAEDITSEVFSKALTHFSRYDSRKATFSTWIFSIARNTLTDYYRRRGREHKTQTKELEPNLALSIDSPVDAAEHSDELQTLLKYLSNLTPKEQELIALKFGGEITNREIARITGLSESNVGTILCRTLRKLRDVMER